MPTGDRGEIVIYQPQEGEPVSACVAATQSVWLDAHQMAALFGRDRTVILRHVRNIYATQELLPEATCAFFAQVAADGKVRQMDLYNLDMILYLGYRVNSKRRHGVPRLGHAHPAGTSAGLLVNERRLQELRQSLRIVGQVLDRYDVSSDQAQALFLWVITDYARPWTSSTTTITSGYDSATFVAPRRAALATKRPSPSWRSCGRPSAVRSFSASKKVPVSAAALSAL